MSEPSLSRAGLPWEPSRETGTIDHYTMCVLIIAARVEQLFQRRARNAANYYDKLTTIDTLPYTRETVTADFYKLRKKMIVSSYWCDFIISQVL